MKKSIIREIFNGRIGNREAMAFEKENSKNRENVLRHYDELKKCFNEKQMEIINKFLGAYDKNCNDEIDFYFTKGFKLGFLVCAECFEDNGGAS